MHPVRVPAALLLAVIVDATTQKMTNDGTQKRTNDVTQIKTHYF
jgi:hypothetical protein